MAKILIINGSRRKKNTYNLLKRIEKEFLNDEVEVLNVSDYNLTLEHHWYKKVLKSLFIDI